jgi:hypothetical protein
LRSLPVWRRQTERLILFATFYPFTQPIKHTQKEFIMPLKSLFAASAVALSINVAAAEKLAPVGDVQTAKVISVVSSIPLAVDLAAYDLAEKAFAPNIVVDYTSLWGGQPNTMTPAELMTSWRGIVPGFSGTWHELSNVKAQVQGNKATATAFVDGRHWLDGKLWRPVGNYQWALEKLDGQWKVTHMTFAMTKEIGDRAVATQAMERAKVK